MDYFEITNKDELLDRYNNSLKLLDSLISGLGKDMIDFIPFDDAWSIREHIAHIADCEINAFLRYRKAVAEPGNKVMPYNIELWKTNLNYSNQDLNLTLDLIRIIRQITLRHLENIKERDWSDYFIEHPTLGKTGLAYIISIYIQHIDKHLEYIKRNIELFRK